VSTSTRSWNQVRGHVREKWGKLTDNDLMMIFGRRDRLKRVLEQRYGYIKVEADQELDDFSRALTSMSLVSAAVDSARAREFYGSAAEAPDAGRAS
jgi:uncharacterized protein YjbJ (UPF0337 family)